MKGLLTIGKDSRDNRERLSEVLLKDSLAFSECSPEQLYFFVQQYSEVMTAEKLGKMRSANDCPYDIHEAENS